MHDVNATETLAPPITQLINSLLLIVALIAVLKASMNRLSSVNSYRVTSHTESSVEGIISPYFESQYQVIKAKYQVILPRLPKRIKNKCVMESVTMQYYCQKSVV